MKTFHFSVFVVVVGLAGLSPQSLLAQGKNADPTPRTFMGPQSASKVRVHEAKQRRNFGVNADELVRTSTQVSSSGQAKSCNTTIGPSGNGQSAGGSPTRYGAGNSNRESTVIVTGDVINVCK